MDRTRIDSLLDRAVRLAVRGHGGAEPNPMVGCVIARDDGTVIAEGFHRRCGQGHAEVEALKEEESSPQDRDDDEPQFRQAHHATCAGRGGAGWPAIGSSSVGGPLIT